MKKFDEDLVELVNQLVELNHLAERGIREASDTECNQLYAEIRKQTDSLLIKAQEELGKHLVNK